MEKRTLYIIIAVVLVAALVLSFGNFTGQFTLGTKVGDCLEDDAGDDPYMKGSVSYSNRDEVYTDYCYKQSAGGEEEWLHEYLCRDKITSQRYFCDGGCVDGKCLEGEVHIVS